jgi:ribosomal protein S12 methylthiotransferase
VDSERILTKLRTRGYAMSADYAGADVVLVNTCSFSIRRRKANPRAMSGRSPKMNGVIVTGCLGGREPEMIRARLSRFSDQRRGSI